MKTKSIIFAALLASLCLPVFSLGESDKKNNRIVLYSSMTENDIGNLTKLFEAKNPGMTIEVVNGSAGELTARIRAEKNNPQGDVMWGGLSNSDGKINADLFEPFLTKYESEIMADYRSCLLYTSPSPRD